MAKREYTPTEARMLNLLNDGEYHTKEELHQCVDDELSLPAAIFQHLHNLRKKIAPKGLAITCESFGRWKRYRLMRLLRSPSAE